MFEYHGWITIQSSAGDEDLADLEAAHARVEKQLELLRGGTSLVDLRWVNGMSQLHISGLLNRRAGEGQSVIDAFNRVGEVAPGSYGLLYILDDEDPAGNGNEFQVLVMRRGQVSQQSDPFLSPCVPVIEDTDD
ncbi:Imm7 family immunity protein [Actinoallomurus rhizosphaericola]|uniref:Imm7 family immunity protein n=1 Tax=Actinoallomurus rhizosphaericola TaxID=2952536 RepID=UPI0020938002|nr:Imm7 family immunity protein [Actinoallomurus rhizosphaericola]MCO5996263.1 immunity 7 family protein [Actinoallomurus rhizosphaericola]